MQLPLSSPAVTARCFWGHIAAGNAQTVFKKDNGDSAKYLVPEGRGSPLQNLNKDGTLAGARAYDAFGVTNYSSGTALTPFELSANMRLNGSHLTLTPVNGALYPELGRAVTGGFRLTHLNGAGGWPGSGCGGECGPIFELHPALPKKRGRGGGFTVGAGDIPGQPRTRSHHSLSLPRTMRRVRVPGARATSRLGILKCAVVLWSVAGGRDSSVGRRWTPNGAEFIVSTARVVRPT
jgi:hypothetical protein